MQQEVLHYITQRSENRVECMSICRCPTVGSLTLPDQEQQQPEIDRGSVRAEHLCEEC